MKEPSAGKIKVILVAFYDIDSFPVCTLHAVLKKGGFDVVSFFFKKLNANNTMTFPTKTEIDFFVSEIKKNQPLFVGMSVRSTHFKLAAELTQRIKAEVETPVLWGGVHATIRPEQSIQHADIVCVGEGENAVAELAARLSRNESYEDISNLWIKKPHDIVRNEVRPLIQDLDRVPFPDFTDEDKYLLEDGQLKNYPAPSQKRTFWIMTSRGCPYSCSYCCNNILRKVYEGKGAYVRRRTVDNVIQELVEAKTRFPKLSFIAFEDDVFTMNLEWLKDFATKYKERIHLPFFCYGYPSTISESLLRVLKDAGATDMTLGIQTGSPEIRRGCYGRRESNEEILKAAQLLNKFGIRGSYDIILDSLIESEADQQMTFDLVASLPRPFQLHTHTLTHFPETDLTKLLLKKNLIEENDVEDQKQKSYQRWTPQLDLKREKGNLYWDNLYYLLGATSISTETVLGVSKIRLFKRCPQVLTFFLIMMREVSSVFRQVMRVPRYLAKRVLRLTALMQDPGRNKC